MAKISEFQWQGGIVLECKECPTAFQFGAGDPEELEEIIKNVVNHKHVVEGVGISVNQKATATGPGTHIMQSGRDLHVSNRIGDNAQITGMTIQAHTITGGLELPRYVRPWGADPRTDPNR